MENAPLRSVTVSRVKYAILWTTHSEAITQGSALCFGSVTDGGCKPPRSSLYRIDSSSVAQALLQIKREPPRSHRKGN